MQIKKLIYLSLSADLSSESTSPASSIPTSPGTSCASPPEFFTSPQMSEITHPHLKDSERDMESRIMAHHDKMYEGIDCSDLIEQLKEADTLGEQADILHYLFMTK